MTEEAYNNLCIIAGPKGKAYIVLPGPIGTNAMQCQKSEQLVRIKIIKELVEWFTAPDKNSGVHSATTLYTECNIDQIHAKVYCIRVL